MTDHAMADEIYLEPLTLKTLERIIEKEKPDSLLSTLGGQTGLTLSMELAKSGFLESHGVKLLGARPLTIDKAEDRQMFKDTMESIGEPCIPSKVVTDYEEALDFAKNVIGLPAIIRPAFTLGGTGGGIANTWADFELLLWVEPVVELPIPGQTLMRLPIMVCTVLLFIRFWLKNV